MMPKAAVRSHQKLPRHKEIVALRPNKGSLEQQVAF